MATIEPTTLTPHLLEFFAAWSAIDDAPSDDQVHTRAMLAAWQLHDALAAQGLNGGGRLEL